MNNKKNIDRLFQEKFKDFDVSPDESLWNRIEGELDTKGKRKKKTPLWWKFSSIAASLALLLAIGYMMLNDDETLQNNPITSNEKEVKTTRNDDIVRSNNTLDIDTVPIKNNLQTDTPTPVENYFEKDNEGKSTNNAIVENINKNSLTAPKTRTHETIKRHTNSSKDINKNDRVNARAATVQNFQDRQQKASEPLTNSKTHKTNATNEEANHSLAMTEKQEIDKNNSEQLFNESHIEKEEISNPESKDKLETSIAKNENLNGKKSLLAVVEEQEKEKEIAVADNAPQNRWSINPNVAPVYYNSFGNGSPIDNQFSDNSKSGELSMSYGIHVAYQVNKKLSVRSGVNKVNYGYNTQDVSFTSSASQGVAMANVNYSAKTANIKVADKNSQVFEAQNAQENSFFATEISASGVSVFDGAMNQNFSYLEVPLEVKYRILDKKFGVNFIGGLSSLFLTDNQITLESNSLVTDVGEANNINNVNFSTNVGIGFDYTFNKSIQFNVEPMFKYQINAFSNSDGGFKPYSLGVYTGLNFKF